MNCLTRISKDKKILVKKFNDSTVYYIDNVIETDMGDKIRIRRLHNKGVQEGHWFDVDPTQLYIEDEDKYEANQVLQLIYSSGCEWQADLIKQKILEA